MEGQMTTAILVGMLLAKFDYIRDNDGKDECIESMAALLSVLFKYFPSEFLIANSTIMDFIERGEL